MLSRCLVRVVIPQLPGCWLLAVCPMKYVAGTVTDWRHAQHHQPPPATTSAGPENTLQSGNVVPSDLQTDLGRVSCPLH